jgi:DNA-binding response OmpR family regulator
MQDDKFVWKGCVLLVDDDQRIREMIQENLSYQNISSIVAKDGVEALELFKKHPVDMIVLDVMMPRLDGWSVVRIIREQSEVPIIMCTARGEEYDKLLGFELGIDDYLVKPFSPKELVARMRAIIKRGSQNDKVDPSIADIYSHKGLSMDKLARTVSVDAVRVSMTPKEFDLLGYLIAHQRQALSREQILSAVWGYEYLGDDRTVDTHIRMLRESLQNYRSCVVTVWGIGYKWEAQ